MNERDQMERANAVYARIEVLDDDLAERLVLAAWLQKMLQNQEASIAHLKQRIQALHVERNAIFHEGDQ